MASSGTARTAPRRLRQKTTSDGGWGGPPARPASPASPALPRGRRDKISVYFGRATSRASGRVGLLTHPGRGLAGSARVPSSQQQHCSPWAPLGHHSRTAILARLLCTIGAGRGATARAWCESLRMPPLLRERSIAARRSAARSDKLVPRPGGGSNHDSASFDVRSDGTAGARKAEDRKRRADDRIPASLASSEAMKPGSAPTRREPEPSPVLKAAGPSGLCSIGMMGEPDREIACVRFDMRAPAPPLCLCGGVQ